MIPIRIHPFFWLVAALIGWMSTGSLAGTIIWMAIILVSVLVHEFGHALTARLFGQNPVVNLVGFGGVTERKGPQLKLWKEFIIVLNGPIAGLLLAGAAYVALLLIGNKAGGILHYAIEVTMWVNIFWTIVNLLPVNPLDGGKLLRIVLEGMFGFRGVKFSTLFSMIFCALFGLVFFAYSFILAGAIFFILAFENFMSWKAMRTMTEVDQDSKLWEDLQRAEEFVALNSADEAWKILDDLTHQVQKGALYISALQLKAQILLNKQHYNDAYTLIKPIIDSVTPEFRRTAQVLAFYGGNTKKAIELGTRAYQDTPHFEIAVINAMCHAMSGDAAPAVGWLQRAYDDGVPNFSEILKKPEFDNIRSDSRFNELQNLYES